ncbi:type III secretion system inner rod subunit SctI [Citrobacter braakii]|uniref:type III secretion system inner rod subunit SctI n=1 Tax=Citrobacter braakii TaxID=57706 RepID=UPI0019035DA4|nr:type III secretion system inner rod subunit SctI [Citrobacter braakii]MBJ9048909.1 type III secretion system inner rod subunit SctI [Citrobacter braakii]
MSVINSVTAMNVATMDATPSTTAVPTADGEQIAVFNKLLFAGMQQGDLGNLTPSQMLVQLATTLGTTVGVDLGAKVAGAVSQSVNKLANMT